MGVCCPQSPGEQEKTNQWLVCSAERKTWCGERMRWRWRWSEGRASVCAAPGLLNDGLALQPTAGEQPPSIHQRRQHATNHTPGCREAPPSQIHFYSLSKSAEENAPRPGLHQTSNFPLWWTRAAPAINKDVCQHIFWRSPRHIPRPPRCNAIVSKSDLLPNPNRSPTRGPRLVGHLQRHEVDEASVSARLDFLLSLYLRLVSGSDVR